MDGTNLNDGNYFFFASWCSACKIAKSKLDDMKDIIKQFDFESNKVLFSKLKISSVPTFLSIKNGNKKYFFGLGEINNFLKYIVI